MTCTSTACICIYSAMMSSIRLTGWRPLRPGRTGEPYSETDLMDNGNRGGMTLTFQRGDGLEVRRCFQTCVKAYALIPRNLSASSK